MGRIVGALLARNEAGIDRYLVRAIRDAQRWATDIVVLDDNSTDGTADIARNLGCVVYTRDNQTPMWGAEAPARAQLWDLAAQHAGADGWTLVFDADMLLQGDPRPLCAKLGVQCVGVAAVRPLGQRDDVSRRWRVALRPSDAATVAVSSRAHCANPRAGAILACMSGMRPQTLRDVVGIAPQLSWLHLGYCKPAHRRLKHQQYLQHAASLTPFEKAHAESIADD
jgi:hypothetical protein